MQSDDIIWQVISKTHCSYKVSVPEKTQQFCRNPYNLSGFCNRKDCPLSNSRYATVREHEGVLYLYTKTIERAHLPSKMWERIALPNNYTQALEMLDKELLYWPEYMIHRCKQRVTKITQYLIKMRKLKLSNQLKVIPIKRRLDRREERREAKALKAAQIERAIEKELIERLKSKAYGDTPLNVNEEIWKQVLAKERGKTVEEQEAEEEEEEEREFEMEEEEGWGGREFVSDDSDDEFGDLSDLEDMDMDDESSGSEAEDEIESKKRRPKLPNSKASLSKRKAETDPNPPTAVKKRPKAHIEVEYEGEHEPPQLVQHSVSRR